MRGVFSRIVVAAAILTSAARTAAAGDVLYWMVDDTAKVMTRAGELVNITTFINPTTDYAARVRVTGSGITEDTFLDLYFSDGTIESGELGVDFDDGSGGSGYWGAGVPTGNQSPVDAYSAGSPEYSFTVELGNIAWDSEKGDWSWTTVVQSATLAYSDLGTYIHQSFDINPPAGTVWAPTFYAVPEPSGGMLVALGLALLALRRKRLSEGA